MGAGAVVMYIALAIMAMALPVSSEKFCPLEMLSPSLSNDGFITSPGYPQSYLSDFCKTWVYYGRPGMLINIRFLDVDIPSYYSDSCTGDYLKIGPFSEQIYCGNISSKSFNSYRAQMTESVHRLRIDFVSNGYGTKGRGFKIYYQFDDTFATSTTSTVSIDGSGTDIHSCHFVFTVKTGEININSTVQDCLQRSNKVSWLIYYPGLDHLDVKYEIVFKQCSLPYLDELKVYDGFTITSNLLGIYSESQCPSYLISLQNRVFIEYTSAGTGVFPKLTLQFIMIEVSHTDSTEPSMNRTVPAENLVYKYSDQCSFVFSDNSGEITSDYLFSAIQKSGFCTWLLHSESTGGLKVTFELTFERFQLSSDSIFNVYDGANISAEILGRRVSVARFSSLKSSQSSMFIYYNPGMNFRSVGSSEIFTIKYYKVVTCEDGYLPCGYGELDCFIQYKRCDGTWHCPLHGGDEKGCPGACFSDFTCGLGSNGCYTENERCNGRTVCPNNVDEQDCDKVRCSSKRGLFLCSNLRCVNNTFKCDRKNDCIDNSDEDGCYSSPSARIILAAVVCTLTCSLVLVITMGCACKFYRLRVRRLNGVPRHESPLSRQLSEMLHNRAPPPPYHEAMLTSRPYHEANLELLNQTTIQSESSGAFNNGFQEIDDPNPLQQQSQSILQGSTNSWDNLPPGTLGENQNPSSRCRTESSRLVEVDTLSFSSERIETGIHQEATAGSDATGNRELPPYSETDTSLLTGSYPEDTWHGGFENVGITDNDIFHVNSDGQSLIQMDMISSHSIQIPVPDQVSTFSSPCLISSNGERSVPSRHHGGCNDEDGSDKDTLSANTSLSIDSSRMKLVEDPEEDKIQEDVDIIDEDSDSDCILAGNEVYDDEDDDSNDSDTVCILNQV